MQNKDELEQELEGLKQKMHRLNVQVIELEHAIEDIVEKLDSEEEEVNPYLLTGEELARTEAKVKATGHT